MPEKETNYREMLFNLMVEKQNRDQMKEELEERLTNERMPHPSYELLRDLERGLLDENDESRIYRHLQGCDICCESLIDIQNQIMSQEENDEIRPLDEIFDPERYSTIPRIEGERALSDDFLDDTVYNFSYKDTKGEIAYYKKRLEIYERFENKLENSDIEEYIDDLFSLANIYSSDVYKEDFSKGSSLEILLKAENYVKKGLEKLSENPSLKTAEGPDGRPLEATAYKLQAEIKEKMGDKAKAENLYEKCLKIQGEDEDIKERLNYLRGE